MQAYHQSASTLNLVRAFTKGGFASLDRVHAWTQEFVGSSPVGQRYEQLATEIDRALRFMRATGMDTESNPTLREVDVWTSHEALLLGYEEALTRQDSTTGGWYDCSAHMLWIGERTRELDGAHVEFLRGVGNPIGCKVGPSMTGEDVLALCEALNPARIPGRLTLITRMGADKVEERLPPLLAAVRDAGHPVVWACDPMHGNTYTSPSGRKTRSLDAIMREVEGFVRAHRAEGTWPGGIHVELTGDDVTECVGGGDEISDADLDHRYETMCDPRLNARQSLDLAFRTAELIRSAATDRRPCRRSTWSPPGRSSTSPRRSSHRDGPPTRSVTPIACTALASLTKPIVAWAMMIAVEEGTSNSTRRSTVDAPAGATLRHLLAHAAGFAFDGEQPIAPIGRTPDLLQHRDRTRRATSSSGQPEMPFGEYLREAVLAPLGMTSAELRGSPAHGVRANLTDMPPGSSARCCGRR